MPRPRGKRRQRERNVYYVVEIDTWDWSYSFGLDKSRYGAGPYREYRHLKLTGKLLRPQKIKADRVEVTLMPDSRLKEESRKQDNPRAVGSLILGGGVLEVLLPIPSDALDAILQTLAAGRLRYGIINSSPLRYRRGLVQDFSLDSTYDPADLPTEEG